MELIEYAIINDKNLYFEVTERHGNFVFVTDNPIRALKVKDKILAKNIIKQIKEHPSTNEENCRIARIITTVEIIE